MSEPAAIPSVEDIDFDDKRRALLPTLVYCGVFFSLYYAVLIVPRFGFGEIFLIDNLGGVFIVLPLVSAYFLSGRFRHQAILLLPSLGAIGAACLFLCHARFYEASPHLWLSAQVIGVVFSIFLGSPRWNTVLFAVNALSLPVAASLVSHVAAADVVHKQAVVYFASLVSIALSHVNLKKKEELLLARNEAMAAERVKTEFLANMSHEMRTPLNGVLGMLTMLKGSPGLSKEQEDMLCTAQTCGDGLLSIINDVLDLSKIESGKVELEEANFDLRACLRESLELVRPLAEEKGLELQLKYAEDVPHWFVGDVTRLRQIAVNFLGNAAKFTSEGRVCIGVEECGVVAPGRRTIRIWVKDSGIGISQEIQARLFTEFTQADSSTTRKYGGTGLGLAISAKLAHLMGGEVQVESELGVGSTFTLSLTLPMGRPEEAASMGATDPPSSSRSLRILLAEDNAVNQKVARLMLRKLGLECHAVGNGQEALEELERAPHGYDLIFMDLQMPVLDGLEATRMLVEQHGEGLPPVVAMTANAFTEDQERCFAAGMSGFVSKPLSVGALRRALKELGLH